MKRSFFLTFACLTLLQAAAFAADAAPAKKKKAAPAAEADSGDEAKTAAPERKRFENYLKARLAKINDNHNLRMTFIKKEEETWEAFWSKVREERKLFEMRQTQQMLSTFQSLTSLEPAQRAAPVADFERMQAGVLKSFEAVQKAKMTEFFAARDAALKEFAAAQETSRAEFMDEATADWQRRKAELLEQEAPVAAKGSKKEDAGEDEEEAPKPKKAKKAPKAKSADAAEDHWH